MSDPPAQPDEEHEHHRPQVEKRRATRNEVRIPFFANAKNYQEKRKNPDEEILFANVRICFFRDSLDFCKKMVARAGIEPTTNCLEGSCSIH